METLKQRGIRFVAILAMADDLKKKGYSVLSIRPPAQINRSSKVALAITKKDDESLVMILGLFDRWL